MNATQDKIQAMINEYQGRINKINKQKFLILSLFIPLLLILGIYLSFAYLQFRKFTTPTSLVSMGYDSTMEALPEAIDGVEAYLVESAPAFVESAFDSLISQIPVVRKATQERMALLIDEALRTLDTFFSASLRSVVGSYREEILSIAEVKDRQQVDILAARVENDLRNKFDPETTKIINKFAAVLEDIDKELGLLTTVHPAHLPQEQLLERRFLELWMQIVEERLPTPVEAVKK